MKICIKCGLQKELWKFYPRSRRKKGQPSMCISCMRMDSKEWHSQNPKMYQGRTYHNLYSRNRLRILKRKFLELYGQSCSCCGDSRESVLTLDHVIPARGQQAKGSLSKYVTALTLYRPDLYQVLCFNCNCLKSSGESCPCGGRRESVKPWMLL
jgi:hypothetical protein